MDVCFIGCDIHQRRFTRTELLVAPAGAEEDAYLPDGAKHGAAVEGLWSGQGKIGGHDLDFAAVIVKEEIRLGRSVNGRCLLCREDAGRQAAKQQSAKCNFLHELSPYCVTFRFTSSNTNEVCRVESSTPLKKIWMVWPLKLSRLKLFNLLDRKSTRRTPVTF